MAESVSTGRLHHETSNVMTNAAHQLGWRWRDKHFAVIAIPACAVRFVTRHGKHMHRRGGGRRFHWPIAPTQNVRSSEAEQLQWTTTDRRKTERQIYRATHDQRKWENGDCPAICEVKPHS